MDIETVKALIDAGQEELSPEIRDFWHVIRIRPMPWQTPDHAGHAWVVAILRRECLWFDDAAARFRISPFERIGQIAAGESAATEFPAAVEDAYRRLTGREG